jgi:hypothetical protein
MSRLFLMLATLTLLLGNLGQAKAGFTVYPDLVSWNGAVTNPTSVTIPDPSPQPFIGFGSGDASVTYNGVTFSQSAALSNGFFYNVGSLFSGDPAVLSSQQQTVGVANILITFPVAVNAFALNYGTFNGSPVTFLLSNGDGVTQGSTGSGYATVDFVGATDTTPFTSVLVTSIDGVLNINDLEFQPTPAPTSIMLLGCGGVCLLLFRLCSRMIATRTPVLA